MSFFVPDQHASLYDDVTQRFRLLIRKQVISTIDEIDLDNWLSNFVSAEDKYLAARILDGLMFRSRAMIFSSIDQLLQCVLPSQLRQWGAYSHRSIEDFLRSLAAGDVSHPVRFVAIERSFANEEPGKSGGVLIRHLRQHGHIARELTCPPERIASLPETVKVLIFIDDIIGSGKQFAKFSKFHKLADHARRFRSLYCPLMAYDKGVKTVRQEHPWLAISPIEQLGPKNQFYCPDVDNPERWALDKSNLVTDVQEHVKNLAITVGIPPATKFSLDLLIAFEHSTPNNTLSLLWARSDIWHPLLNR